MSKEPILKNNNPQKKTWLEIFSKFFRKHFFIGLGLVLIFCNQKLKLLLGNCKISPEIEPILENV